MQVNREFNAVVMVFDREYCKIKAIMNKLTKNHIITFTAKYVPFSYQFKQNEASRTPVGSIR